GTGGFWPGQQQGGGLVGVGGPGACRDAGGRLRVAGRADQNRAIAKPEFSPIQKLIPSAQAPIGWVPGPVEREPIGVKSAAFQRETLSPVLLVMSTRWPSNAAAV